MLPSSHEVLIQPPPPPLGAEEPSLAGAFADFIAASARLESSYRDLQAEVAELSQALVERNRALSESLSENRSMGDRLQRILDAVPCGVLVVDERGGMQLANPEASRLLALAPEVETVPGLRLELTPPGAVRDAAGGVAQEYCFEGAAGQTWVEVRRMPLQPAPAEGRKGLAEAVLTISDISARKRLEMERESARDAVALAQVSALLAHEIRNPLASLELFAGLLEDHPERGGEWLRHLRAGIRTMSGTVNNVLALYSHTPVPMEETDVAAECALAVRFLQPLAQQAGVELRLVAPAGAIYAQANRSAIHQVLLNLCSNALRHTAAGGWVTVVCAGPASGAAPLQVTVSDNGTGISPEHLRHIFEVGFSGSGATPGLGLAVCQRLVTQFGGKLRAESRMGHGATFTLELAHA